MVPLSVDLGQLPGFRRLAVDYAHDFAAVAPFFSGDPASRSAWATAIAHAQSSPRDRARLVDLLEAQQRRRQAPDAAIRATHLLADPKAVAVVTGQQAGLFGGPLFTLLKALTAVKLAADTTRDHGVPTVAVFWIDAEDHDWEEVRSCTVFDEALAPRTVSLAPRGDRVSLPIGATPIGDEIGAILKDLESLLPPTEFRDAIIKDLSNAYVPGRTVADAFGRWLEHLLGPLGLIVFDSSDPQGKQLAVRVFSRELASAGSTSQFANRAGHALEERGYHAQVQVADGSIALFHLNEGREPIRRQRDKLITGNQEWSAADLAKHAAAHPESFSPSVLLRPIVQDTIFPTICYVPGPNELAYLGQLRDVYGHFDVPMPLMYPRVSATILDAAAMRFLGKYELPLRALQQQDEAALNDLLAREIPSAVEDCYSAAATAVESTMSRLIDALPGIDPTLAGAGQSTVRKMQHDLETLHGKMLQAVKRRHETVRRQFLRAQSLAFPGGSPQERAISFVSLLNLHGSALIDRLMAELPLDLGKHWIVVI